MSRPPSLLLAAAVGLLGLVYSDGQSPELDLQAVPEYERYPSGKQDVKAAVSIIAPNVDQNRADRGTVAVTCVVDRSGSMEGKPIELVKRSVDFVSSQLNSQDYFGIVSYANEASEDVTLDRDNRYQLAGALESIAAGGGTNLAAGLLLGVEQAAYLGDTSGSTNVFLFSDGVANVGTTLIEQLGPQLTDAIGGQSIKVSTFAFGDADLKYLESLAEIGRGETYHIQAQSQIASAFGLALAGLVTTIANNIKIKLQPVGGAVITELLQSGSACSVFYFDLFGGERRDIFLSLSVPDSNSNEQEILKVEATYTSEQQPPKEVTKRSSIVISRGAREESAPFVPIVLETQARFATANALRDAAKAASDEQRISILEAASTQVQGLKDEAGGKKDLDIDQYLQALGDATAQVQDNTYQAAAGSLSAQSIGGQRYTGSMGAGAPPQSPAQMDVVSSALAFVGN